jgi:hypothetical protein
MMTEFGGTMYDMDEFDDQLPGEDVEVVDGLPVLAEVREVQHVRSVGIGAVHAAAAAATGFVAGAATLALARRLGARRLAGASREIGRRADPLGRPWLPGETRTYVVRVRVIDRGLN